MRRIRRRSRTLRDRSPELEGLFERWVRASSLGWLLGVAVVVGLALVGEALQALGVSDLQFMVGVGMGTGVGFAQGRALSPWLGRPTGWTLATGVGMGGLFAARDVVVASGHRFPYSLPLYVVLGSLVVGLWQARLLSRGSPLPVQWVLISVVAWSIPASGIALGDSGYAGVGGELASLGALFLGGVVLGLVSGPVLVRVLGRPAGSAAPPGHS